MFKRLKKLESWQKPSFKDYNLLVDRLNSLSKITTNAGGSVTTSLAGVHLRMPNPTTILTIFEVQAVASPLGDGIYNCYRQKLDATEWKDTDGDDRFDDYDTTAVEVFNLLQNNAKSIFENGLALYDRIAAWQWTDDEGNTRWVGIPIVGGMGRMARTTEAATANDHITCNLIRNDDTEQTSGLGSSVEVYCKITGGTALNAALPRLANDDYLPVMNLNGTWWSTQLFQTSEDCVCTSP